MISNKIDVFHEVKQEPEEEGGSHTIEQSESVRKSKKKVLWISCVCVSFVSLAAWAAWPESLESKVAPVNPSPDFNAPLPDPKLDYDITYPVVSVLPPNDGSEYHQAGVKDQGVQETVSTQAASSPAVDTEAASEKQDNLADYEKKISELEQKVLKLTQQLEKKSASTASRKPKPQPVEQVAFSSAAMKGSVTLNTIYRGQAWIQKDDQTFLVEEGDQFFGARIQKIDPENRKVITSLGVIR